MLILYIVQMYVPVRVKLLILEAVLVYKTQSLIYSIDFWEASFVTVVIRWLWELEGGLSKYFTIYNLYMCVNGRLLVISSLTTIKWIDIATGSGKEILKFCAPTSFRVYLGLLCILCFTSLVKVTSSYTEDEPNFVRVESKILENNWKSIVSKMNQSLSEPWRCLKIWGLRSESMCSRILVPKCIVFLPT